jgi:hypothetical protein
MDTRIQPQKYLDFKNKPRYIFLVYPYPVRTRYGVRSSIRISEFASVSLKLGQAGPHIQLSLFPYCTTVSFESIQPNSIQFRFGLAKLELAQVHFG